MTGRGADGPCPGRSQRCPGGLTSEVLLRRQVSEDSPQGTETRRHRARPPGRARPGRRHVAAQLLRWGSACPRPVTVTEVLCLLGLGSLRRSCVSTRAASSAPARGRAWPMWGARRSPCCLGEKNPVTEVSVAPLAVKRCGPEDARLRDAGRWALGIETRPEWSLSGESCGVMWGACSALPGGHRATGKFGVRAIP